MRKIVVKSRSNVTKEIHLTEELESRGIEVIETDIGEQDPPGPEEKNLHTLLALLRIYQPKGYRRDFQNSMARRLAKTLKKLSRL